MVSEVYHNLLYLPLYVANNQGFLEENRIELSSIRAAGSGPTALSSVISGESAFSFHGPEHVAFANAKGRRCSFTGPSIGQCSSMGGCTRRSNRELDSGFQR
ncbi:ABC transporter substrate-binding protein [Paenibacillus amylolyticus]|nr:ABC transporter substrate-binding protein [Paenibacillus amylolyticus]